METQLHDNVAIQRRQTNDDKEHAARVIEDTMNHWRKLHRALILAEAQSLEVPLADCRHSAVDHALSIKVLQYKCDRALNALAAARPGARGTFVEAGGSIRIQQGWELSGFIQSVCSSLRRR